MSVKITKINISSYYNLSYYMSQTVSNSDSQCTDSPQLSLWHPFFAIRGKSLVKWTLNIEYFGQVLYKQVNIQDLFRE